MRFYKRLKGIGFSLQDDDTAKEIPDAAEHNRDTLSKNIVRAIEVNIQSKKPATRVKAKRKKIRYIDTEAILG